MAVAQRSGAINDLVAEFGPQARTVATFIQEMADADDAMHQAQKKICSAIDSLPLEGTDRTVRLLNQAWKILQKARES